MKEKMLRPEPGPLSHLPRKPSVRGQISQGWNAWPLLGHFQVLSLISPLTLPGLPPPPAGSPRPSPTLRPSYRLWIFSSRFSAQKALTS